MVPSAPIVQKFPRTATSRSVSEKSMPRASRTPRGDIVLERVVAEESEVTGTAARSNPRQHRDTHATDAPLSQSIRFGVLAVFELGLATRLERKPTQSVTHIQDDFGLRRHEGGE